MSIAHPQNKFLYTFKKVFRTTKTFAPALTNAKFAAQRMGRRLARKPHEKDFRALALMSSDKPEADFLFLDIGANRGQTIDSVRLYRNYSVISIEANPRLAERLRRQTRRDGRVVVMNYAMSNSQGETTLYVPAYRGYSFDGLASMIRSEAESWLDESRIYGFRRELLTILEMKVPTNTLDNLDLAPDFVKIDVQGAELLVLQGARRTLETHRPILLVELPSDESEGQFLADLGYCPYTFHKGRFLPGISPHGNSFFLMDQHRQLFQPDAFEDTGRTR